MKKLVKIPMKSYLIFQYDCNINVYERFAIEGSAISFSNIE